MIALVTGPIQIGKTTVCRKTVAFLREGGVQPGGILCPSRWNASGKKTGIDVVDLCTEERRPFARVDPRGPGSHTTVGRHVMDDDAVKWALLAMMEAIINGSELLVVDEIGPLELRKRGGFEWVLGPLSDPDRVPHAMVVVRDYMLEELAERLSRPDARTFVIARENRDGIPLHIAEELLEVIRWPVKD